MDAIEAMETCRAMRYLREDPVPEETLRRLVHAATRASNPGNSQGWEFVVLRERAGKERIAKALRVSMRKPLDALAEHETNAVRQRVYKGVDHLLHTLERVPALVFVCARAVYPPDAPSHEMVMATVYPAAQNLVVAARALGLGTVFTTFHTGIEPVVREVLQLPDDVHLGVMIPVGFPERAFGLVARKPVDEVLHWERW